MNQISRLFIIALLLTACAGPPPPATPVATPTTAPATAPPTPPAATLPPASGSMPAPLYVLERGQIARIERDAATRVLLTSERSAIPGVPPIATFTVAPSGALAYVVGDLESDRLSIAGPGGENVTVLYSVPGHELSDLLFTPDSAAIFLRLLNNNQTADVPSGLYRLPASGGAPELVLADDPVDDPANPSRAVSSYLPVAFSPDGDQLLVEVQSLFYEDCGIGFMPAGGGEVLRVTLPPDVRSYCGEEAWTPDGRSVLFLAGPKEGPQAGPQLWRADATSGVAELIVGGDRYARAPVALASGAIRYFLASVERDASGVVVGGSFAPAELAAPGAEPRELGPALSDRLERALWAPGGAGAVIEIEGEQGVELRWHPIGGEATVLPSARERAGGLAWGPVEPRSGRAAPVVALLPGP
ncbi:MAG: hypothetical protein N2378_01100 [Chloroflexaceae bacterium]|nr:hypothetical protein [Chloroflexaceae bacterium]